MGRFADADPDYTRRSEPARTTLPREPISRSSSEPPSITTRDSTVCPEVYDLAADPAVLEREALGPCPDRGFGDRAGLAPDRFGVKNSLMFSPLNLAPSTMVWPMPVNISLNPGPT
jgi:hypothetical protein